MADRFEYANHISSLSAWPPFVCSMNGVCARFEPKAQAEEGGCAPRAWGIGGHSRRYPRTTSILTTTEGPDLRHDSLSA